jgi:hypothetical protein
MSNYNEDSNLIFVHIPKNAGSSMESYPFIGGSGHEPILSIKQRLPEEIFDNAFKFAFVRNPWDRVVSAFFHGSRNLVAGTGIRWRDPNSFDIFVRFMYQKGLDLPAMYPEFMTEPDGSMRPRSYPIHHHFLPQWFFVTDERGATPMNFIGYYENLTRGWERVLNTLGRDFVSLPRTMAGMRPVSGYHDYYTDETAEMVGELYKRDCELFAYDF